MIKRAMSQIVKLFLAMMVALVLTSCQESEKNRLPVISGNLIVSPATVPVRGCASITAIATDPDKDNIVYYWQAQKGEVPDGAQGDTVLYTAPGTSGLDTVTVTVSDGQGTTTREVQISVVATEPTAPPGPTDTPLVIPTNTPVPVPTESPTPLFTETPNPTDTPAPVISVPVTRTIGESGITYVTDGDGGVSVFSLDPPRTVDQIRIDMQQRASEYGYSIWEVEAYGPESGDTNLVADAMVTASLAQNDVNCPGCFAANVVDGDPDTRWASEWFDPQWIEVSLSAPQSVSRVVLRWEKAYAQKYHVSTLAAYTLNVASKDSVSQTFNLRGGYTSQVNQDIWIMVGPFGENLWPQSLDACAGQGTAKVNGFWEVPATAGGPGDVGDPFEIIVYTANDQASRFLSKTLRTWCQEGNYPGFPRGELPEGLDEHQHITVQRGSQGRPPSPDISNVDLPGQVALENIHTGETLSQTLKVGGVYTGVSDPIWMLVHAPDGRYYPQSHNACQGISTVQSDGLWSAMINVGGDGDAGKPFELLVVVADQEAHAVFKEREKTGCETGDFPGYLFIELPTGIDQKANVSVTRR